MRMTLPFVLFCVCVVFSISTIFAQSIVRGNVVDKADDTKLHKATVVLLSATDSILYEFKRTNESGNFEFKNIPAGTYQFIVSYPQFADLIAKITIEDDNSMLDLGKLKLSKAAQLLEEIAITGKIPIVINGDTIEYNADSFKVNKDAKVDDLLKVMPGITIDANGKITAQGKEVKKVLLDGEEFFGNDPTLITKNIRADMVDKVQVYEKKSDLADRTGIDDGERTQTINIKLKEDKKKGAFGQLLGGVGSDKYYTGKAMVNRFNGTQKIAAYGIAANDGLVSLDFEEGQKYNTSNGNSSVGDDGSIFIMSSGSSDGLDSWSGVYEGNGVPRALNLGASYTDKFSGDKHKVNVGYRRGQMEVENNNTTITQNNFPQNASIDDAYRYTFSERKSDNANFRYDFKIDSLSDLTLKMGYSKSKNDDINNVNSSEKNLQDIILNTIESRNTTSGINENLDANIMLTRRFMKPKRSVTLNSSIRSSRNDSKGNYYSFTDFRNNADDIKIDQFKNNLGNNNSFSTSLNYSEPISKRITATIGYSINNNKSLTLNESFNFNPVTNKYDLLDQNVLNDFNHKQISNGVNAGMNFKDEKWNINLNNTLSFEDVEREYKNLSSKLSRDQISLRPNASIRYAISKSKSISLYYNGYTNQPNLNQIEPLKQNSNTLINYLDNKELEAGFSNRLNLSYNSYKQLKDISFYVYGNVSQNSNAIGSMVNFDSESGKRNIQFVNIDKANYSAYLNASYRMPIWKKIALSLSFGGNMNYSNNYNYLSQANSSSALNKSESSNYSSSISFNSYKSNKWSFYVSFSPGYNRTVSSLQPELNSKNFILNSFVEGSYTFPQDFTLNFTLNQNHEGATPTLPEFNMAKMNGYISKKFLKDKSLEAQVFVNDIFNQNIGVRRNQYGYSVIQSSNDVLRRFGMLKLIYNFTTMKGDN